MFDFTSSSESSKTLTIETFQKLIHQFYPPLYYGTADYIEKGNIIICDETEDNPEYIIFHPDDIEEVKKMISTRTLVHLKDEPKEDQLERLRNKIFKEVEYSTGMEFVRSNNKYSGGEG
jgi:ABC-type uncharacterized transport system substrate-binding protein